MDKKKRRNKSDLGENYIAPDGGYAWIVCIAAGLSVLSIISIWFLFGLIFRQRFLEIGLTSAQMTAIVNIQPGVASMLGLFSGAIFRRFSYRQVALTATSVASFGILLASFSYSFITYMFSLSIIYGAGYGMVTSSNAIAVNTYFLKNRRKARSFALTISAAGHTLSPHLANYLISNYGVRGTVLIFSAITMHSFAFGLLLQPAQWHSKKLTENDIALLETNKANVRTKMTKIDSNVMENDEPLIEKVEVKLNWLKRILKFFDFDLLKNRTYCNLIIGLTLAAFSETNSQILIPFFLSDFNFNSNEIATAMSCLGFGDLITRFLIPFITDRINWNNRVFFLIGITGLTTGRILIAQIPRIEILIVIFCLMGICRALRTVFMGLVIPDHLPLNKLPAGIGLSLFSTGFFTILCGPLVGTIRDSNGSKFMLYFLSLISSTTVVLWSVELIYCRFRKKSEPQQENLEVVD